MYLTRHQTTVGPRWAVDGNYLPTGLSLGSLLSMPQSTMLAALESLTEGEEATAPAIAPVEPDQEVWGAGVTYMRSREARKAESTQADVYERVYDAERPEIFFKSVGWRTVGDGDNVRIRADTTWNVPEPELALVINAGAEIVGYAVGNDMSSRDIEGENPLYLPQAKTYAGSCAIGPGIQLASATQLTDIAITMTISREGQTVFSGETSTAQMKRQFGELAAYLLRELDFPHGVFLMTGTGIVPPDDFSLKHGDLVRISVADLSLENRVA